MKLLLKNVNVLNPHQKLNETGIDLLIVDGKISKIEKNISDKNDKVIDLSGKYVVPGFFDMHVHLREPGREDEETIETGCNSAAAGGFTAIACMPNTEPAIDSAEVISLIKERAKNNLVNVHPIAAVSVNRKGEMLSPMGELVEAGAVGFSDDGAPVKTSNMMKRALEYSSMYNVPIIDHCEDESLLGGSMNESFNSTLLGMQGIPSVSEDIMVMRDILLTEYSGGKLHIAHISTKGAVDLVRSAKKKGIKVTAEVTPHHFSLTDDLLKSYDTNLKMSPPLRTKEDVEAIIEGLKDGTIDCIASDHAPHSIEEKEVEFDYAPNGILGLETEVGIALNELYNKGILTLEQIIEKFAINPRKILGLKIPEIKADSIAELTILDLENIWTFDIKSQKSKSRNTPFDKKLFNGKAVGVINNNKLYFNNKFENI